MLPDPKIIFLDEVTGHIDEDTENAIMEMVESEFKGITVLAISHRLKTLRDFDHFIRLDDGKAFDVPRDEIIAMIGSEG